MVESLVTEMLKMTKLDFLPENEFADIVTGYVHNPEKEAIPTYVSDTINYIRTQLTDVLSENLENEERLKRVMFEAKENRVAEYASRHSARTIVHGQAAPKTDVDMASLPKESRHLDDYDDDFEGEVLIVPVQGKKKRAPAKSAAKPGPARAAASAAGRAKKARPEVSDEELQDEEPEDEASVATAKATRSTRSTALPKSRAGADPAAIRPGHSDESDNGDSDGMETASVVNRNRKPAARENIISDSDSDNMDVDRPVPTKKAPVSRKKAPSAPAAARSAAISQVNSINWHHAADEEEDEIREVDEPASAAQATIPKKRGTPSILPAATKRSAGGASLRQTSLNFANSQLSLGVDSVPPATAKPRGRAPRRDPFAK
ncbi:hypothetical protein HDU91_003058 [Kappamyces sp. JEL0680]|nr:hypothetical protein HDU91_003058 [Kappamyces sp. JEL0680]